MEWNRHELFVRRPSRYEGWKISERSYEGASGRRAEREISARDQQNHELWLEKADKNRIPNILLTIVQVDYLFPGFMEEPVTQKIR